MKGFFKKQEVTTPKRKKANRRKISGCESCKQYHKCENGKFSTVGTGETGILIIDEMVSTQEENSGKPLSGIVQKFLKYKLAEVGIDIDKCWYTKSIKCFIPENNPAKVPNNVKTSCKTLMWEEIKRLNPQKILLFGDLSIEMFYSDRLAESRIQSGNWNRFYNLKIPDVKAGTWVYPNNSPRKLLEVLAEKKNKLKKYNKLKNEKGPFWEWESLTSDAYYRILNLYFTRYLKEAIQHKEKYQKCEYEKYTNSIETVEEATMIIKSLNKPGILGTDFESNMIGCYHPDAELLTVSLSTKNVSYGFNYYGDNPEFVQALRDLYENPEIGFIVHNAVMEISWAKKIIGCDIVNIEADTLLLSHMLRPAINSANSLKFNVLETQGLIYDQEVEEYISAPARYEWIRGKKKKIKSSNYDINRMKEFNERKRNLYCGYDSWFTVQVYLKKFPLIKRNKKQYALYRTYVEGIKVFTEMGSTGFHVDEEQLIKNLEICDKKLTILGDEIQKAKELDIWYENTNKEFNPDSGDHLREFFFELLNYDTPKRTDRGLKSTDGDVLNEIANTSEVARLIAEYAKYSKIEVFLKGIQRNTINHRLHGNLGLSRASTGRSNSAQPNLQNLSSHEELATQMIKGVLKPEQGKQLLAFDYAQLESRGGYSIHQDPCVKEEILNPHLDVHALMSQHIFFDNDKATKRLTELKHPDKIELTEADLKTVFKEDMRAFGKMVNFSAMFGVGVEKMFRSLYLEGFKPFHKEYFAELGIDTAEKFRQHTRSIHEAYWERYKVLAKWRNDFWEKYLQTGEAWSPEGWCINTVASKNLICNFAIQGSSFVVCLKSLIKLHKEMKKRNYESKIFLMIHDSLEFMTTYEEYFGKGLKELIYECLVDYPNNTVPWLKINMDIDGEFYGESWAEELSEEKWREEYEQTKVS